ncbi:uncharacterized membrane-anchored protein YitT (DUF2179 family) [Paenibacillus sp. SORGH_AS306]|nr:uncharacterized membrane-anchored protein YitT (DUF2179 family) [Paenibacillus sp. SORGH_AS_0306]
MPRKHRKLTPVQLLAKFIFITTGAVMMAVALEIFLIPNTVIDGGITGISIILSEVTPVPLGLFIFIINVPFLIIGYKQIGKTCLPFLLYTELQSCR